MDLYRQGYPFSLQVKVSVAYQFPVFTLAQTMTDCLRNLQSTCVKSAVTIVTTVVISKAIEVGLIIRATAGHSCWLVLGLE